jgi:putative ABC transport system permease protein
MRLTNWLYTLPLKPRSLFRGRQAEQDLNDELRDHLDRRIEENIAKGMNPQEAKRAALIALGGIEQTKEQCRDARNAAWIESTIHDLTCGWRSLRNSLGFTVVAILTLALGLTAVSTIFSLVQTVMLRPLNFPHSDRVVVVSQALPAMGSGPIVANLGEFQRWQQSGLFQYAAALETADYVLLGRERSERISGVRATPDFFQIFRVQPLLGRGFVASDGTPGHEDVIVLSHQLWMRAFAGDPNIIGKTIRTSDAVLTVIGVMPARFDFPRLADVQTIMSWAPEQTEFWTPLPVTQEAVEQGNFNYYVLGRLNDGVTIERAASQFQTSAVQLARDEEQRLPAYRERIELLVATLRVQVTPLQQSISWGIRGALWMLLAAVGLLLALVLFNLGNLLLTRNVARLREFVVRETLGATRWRLFRESLSEQILMVASAALFSLFLSTWTVSMIRSVAATRLPRLYELSIDAPVTAGLMALSLAIAVIFGALPLLVLPDSAINSLLQSQGRTSTSGRRTNRIKSILMAMQIGVAVVLLIGAGLLIQSFRNVMRVNPGFDPHNVLNLSVYLNPVTNPDDAKRLAHTQELVASLRNIPGVESASVINHVPFTGEIDIHDVYAVAGSSLAPQREGAEYRVVDANYFHTMRIPLLAGRKFRGDEAGEVAIINRRMAATLWPNQDALGRQFRDGDNPPLTVVGIVESVHDSSLDHEPRMQFYRPLASNPWSGQFLLRTRIDPAAVVPIAEQTVWRLDAEQAVSHPQTIEHLIEATTLDRRFETALLAGFAAAALFLATLGLFSIASLSVTQRTREFGIRLALGAQTRDLLRSELFRTLRVVSMGIACGLGAAVVLAKAISGFLFGVTPWSASVYTLAIAVLVTSTIVAAWIPARHAAKINPTEALRYE